MMQGRLVLMPMLGTIRAPLSSMEDSLLIGSEISLIFSAATSAMMSSCLGAERTRAMSM